MASLPTDRPVTPLRQRMLDDMAMRSMRVRTQHDYIRHVCAFAAFLGGRPKSIKHSVFSHSPRLDLRPNSVGGSRRLSGLDDHPICGRHRALPNTSPSLVNTATWAI